MTSIEKDILSYIAANPESGREAMPVSSSMRCMKAI